MMTSRATLPAPAPFAPALAAFALALAVAPLAALTGCQASPPASAATSRASAAPATPAATAPSPASADRASVAPAATAAPAAPLAADAHRAAPLPRLATKIAAGEPIRIVLFGDSISEVGRSPRWHGGASAPEHNWGAVLRDHLAHAYPHATFSVHHFSIGGQNAYEGLGRVDWLWEHQPDLVLVAFGTNDLWHHELAPHQTARALDELVRRITPRADVVLVSTAGNNPSDPRFQHTAETVAATESVAVVNNLPFVNMRAAIMALTDHARHWADYHLAETNCHPNDAGHRAWADVTAAVIQQSLAATATAPASTE